MSHDDYQIHRGKILTPSFVVLLALTLIGFALIAVRFIKGIGAVSNMSDGYPWGILGLPILKDEAPAEFSEKIQHTIYKGFIATVALYSTLCFIALKNMKKGQEERTLKTGQKDKGQGEEHT